MGKLVLIPIAGVIAVLLAGQSGEHAYVAQAKCKMCHKGVKNGEIFEKWEAGPHARAYATLAGDEAKAAYAKLGKTGDPQQDPACLRCHVTGYGAVESLTVALEHADGVSCQACHGAGADYYKKSVMEDRAAAIANGMISDPKAKCVTCHNEESPTYKPFDVEKRWLEIAHAVPETTP